MHDTLTENQSFSLPLDSQTITIGRGPDCDITLHAVGISKKHASITLKPSFPVIRDLGSSFGIRCNRKLVKEAVLEHDCTISIGVVTFAVTIVKDTLYLTRTVDFSSPEQVSPVQDVEVITIGRDSSNTIQLSHPLVSRFHCTIKKTGDKRYALTDHGSTNGSFINGELTHQGTCTDGDVIQIGPYRFVIDNGNFVQADDSKQITLEAHNLTVRKNNKNILDNISLSIKPGKFVSFLGPSGAGKTTLAKVLTGQQPADGGAVYYNGFPLNKYAAAFRSAVGYVSQHNLLRPELTVWETFSEQVLLRLPKDSLEAERVTRIREVMEMLSISPLSKCRISTLSGGEAKRVHLGIELLSSPTIIFLDEPFAGLDPGLIHKFMVLFRELCEKGYTLLLTTHTLEQIELCDCLFFLNRGQLVYQGTPEETAKKLQVSSIAEAYERVRTNDDVVQRVTNETVAIAHIDNTIKKMPAPNKMYRRPQSAGFMKQLAMLILRYTRILVRDYANLILILLQAPLIALLLALVFHHGSQFLPLSFYFCLTISAIWIGGVNSVREIAREQELYDREFRAGLSSSAYVAAKCSVFSLLALLQATLFTASLHYGFDAFSFNRQNFILITITTISGTILGLAISAFSGNINRAVSMLPIIFIPQIFFSGILFPFDRMPEIGAFISHGTISRPAFSMFKKVCLLDQHLSNLDEWWPLAILNSILIISIVIRVRWYRFFTRSGLH